MEYPRLFKSRTNVRRLIAKRKVTVFEPTTSNFKQSTPNRSVALIVPTAWRGILCSRTHHAQCQERIQRPVSLTSNSPNGHGTLRQVPVDTVTW